ncbi:MAG: acyloxyacyl hydrolase [Flavobacteriales bacterium]|nr:acyloxyacyl hydrolase [Flavobacteriales bacterium]
MVRDKRSFLLACLIVRVTGFTGVVCAQDELGAPFSLGLSGHHGFIIPHSQELVDVSTSHPRGVELNAAWLLADEHHTRASGVVSRRGVAMHLIDFGAPDLLGHMLSVSAFVEPMIRAQDRVHGSVRLALGLAYLDQPYDPETNPGNLFYSTNISFLACVNAYLGLRINPQWEASGGFNYNHISNGGMKQPNKGMNFPTWSLGASYCLRPVVIQRPIRDDAWRTAKRTYTYLVGSASVKNAPATDGNDEVLRCSLLGILGVRGWRVGRMAGLSAGTEWVHDGYAEEMSARDGANENGWMGAVMAGPELLSGRVRFALLFGAYVYALAWSGDAVYQRYQLSYTVGRGLMVGTSLKAHRHVADVFDLRLGWVW